MNAKNLKIIIIVIGLLGGGALLIRSFTASDEPTWDHVAYLVDVETGETFEADTTNGIMSPARHPDSKKVSLLRMEKGEDGVWMVLERDLALTKTMDVPIKAIDPATGRVLGEVNLKTYKNPYSK